MYVGFTGGLLVRIIHNQVRLSSRFTNAFTLRDDVILIFFIQTKHVICDWHLQIALELSFRHLPSAISQTGN